VCVRDRERDREGAVVGTRTYWPAEAKHGQQGAA
jgi:hypothetical protein